jgi:SAM-dependent methyltransferase
MAKHCPGEAPSLRSRVVDAHPNLQVYSRPDVVDFYVQLEGLFPTEEYLFSKYIPVGSNVLDVGVGAGRTTPHLAARAKRYVGVDCSPPMIEQCRRRFPAFEFILANATDLSGIPDASFDAAVFSYNGIDYVPTDEARITCLRELRRVTRPSGSIILSSHHARGVAGFLDFEGANLVRVIWRLVRAGMILAEAVARRLAEPAFWRGSGYIQDTVHGGLHTHFSTPASIARDASAAGLTVVEHRGHFYRKQIPSSLPVWIYYVLKRSE